MKRTEWTQHAFRYAISSAIWLSITCMVHRVRATSPFDDPYAVPDAPRPPTLPELTHHDVEATIESTVGALSPQAGATGSADHASLVYVQRLALELPSPSRRYFAGLAYETALGGPPTGGTTRFVSGNLEGYGRLVWATRTGLTFGGGLGLLFPTAHFTNDGDAAGVAVAATAVRPWDYSFFDPNSLTLHPFVDARVLEGNFVIQFRQGLDCAFTTGGGWCTKLAGISELYLGYRFGNVGAGLELFQLYLIDAAVDDAHRAYFTASPSIRLLSKYVQPAISATTSLGNTLSPTTGHVYGIRLAATFVWDVAEHTISGTEQ